VAPPTPPAGLPPAAAAAVPPAAVAAEPLAAVAAEPPAAAAAVSLAAVAAADSIEALRQAVAAFDGCDLRDTASTTVFTEGDPASSVLLIGEPPGREEDRSGRAFLGEEGALLDRMLASLGLARAQLMLVPVVPWRPPGGRPVSSTELAQCLPFLHRLIALQAPRQVLLLGLTAVRAIVPSAAMRKRDLGVWVGAQVPGAAQPCSVVPLPGLAEMVQAPANRRHAWAALRRVRRALDAGGP